MCNCHRNLSKTKQLAQRMANNENIIYAVIKYPSGNYNFMTKEIAINNKMNIVYETI